MGIIHPLKAFFNNKSHLWIPPWWKGNRVCLLCGRHEGITVGENSIQLSPSGTDVIKWSASGVPSAQGDLGMDSATGLPQCYTGGSATALSTSGGSGGLIFVEKKTIESNSQQYDFSSLDGDSDYVYFMTYSLINNNGGGSAASYYVRPNGSNTNCSSTKLRWYSGTSHAVTSNASEIQIGEASDADYTFGAFYFFANSESESQAFNRSVVSLLSTDLGGYPDGYAMHGLWQDTSTNLTSIRIYSTVADGLGKGSEMVLYKLAQS